MPRVALVTGAARGIGRAIAIELAEAGNKVVVADILDDEAAATAADIEGLAVHLDITDTASVETATQHHGPIEILVNCAGWDELKPFVETDEAFWNQILEINFKGCLRTCRAILPTMVENQ